MKKLLLPILALLLVACSSDDDQQAPIFVQPPVVPSFLKATINGTEYTFNTFEVETNTVVDPGHTYVDLNVTATINGDESKNIVFSLEQDVPGADTIYFFYLMNGADEFDTDHTGAMFNTNVTTNANKRIIGTFSGALAKFDNTSTAEITNGSFDISY